MKKIMFTTFLYEEGGGTKKVIDNLIKYYNRNNFKTKLLIINSPIDCNYKKDNKSKLKFYLNKRNDFNLLKTIKLFQEEIEKFDPDRIYIILGHSFVFFLGTILPKKYLKRTILYFLDPWFTFKSLKDKVRNKAKKFIKIRDKLLCKSKLNVYNIFNNIKDIENKICKEVDHINFWNKFNGIITCSKDMEDFFIKKGIKKNKLLYNPLFVNVNSVITNKFFNNKIPMFMYTGRVTSSWKGFGIVLEALQNINKFNLELYTWDRKETLLAKKLFKKYNLPLSSLKTFSGLDTNELLPNMMRATAVLIPSIAEGFSFTMLESLSVGGITIMGPLYGGPKDVMIDYYNGFLFYPGDSNSLSLKLNYVIKERKDKLDTIRINAINTAKQYTLKKYLDKLNKKFPL